MKVYLELPSPSRGLQRVYDALIKYKPPHVEIVMDEKDADLVIIHVIGRKEQVVKRIQRVIDKGKSYAMIQYCLKSTLNPDVRDWMPAWLGAKLVWSYYDLPEIAYKEEWMKDFVKFYISPLGVSPYFEDKHSSTGRDFIIGTCSEDELTEGTKEAVLAAQRLNMQTFHLGKDVKRPNALCRTDISDTTLAHFWSRCQFVSGLRKIEGFEFPAAEGLICGARPIFYDYPCYRKWYEDLGAIFIPDGTREETMDRLEAIFAQGCRPTTDEQRHKARERFSWPTIINNFWNKL